MRSPQTTPQSRSSLFIPAASPTTKKRLSLPALILHPPQQLRRILVSICPKIDTTNGKSMEQRLRRKKKNNGDTWKDPFDEDTEDDEVMEVLMPLAFVCLLEEDMENDEEI
jgi:hypothetical protein